MGIRKTASTGVRAVAVVCLSCVVLPLTAHSEVPAPRGWQNWGAWQVMDGYRKVKCRNYVDATTDGNDILITSSVTCDQPYSAALYASGFGPGYRKPKPRFCDRIPAREPCVISYRIDNPRGEQQFGMATTSNYIKDQVPAAAIRFRV